MKNSVILLRGIFDHEVRQNHKTTFFNLKDLSIIGNQQRIKEGLPMRNINDYFRLLPNKEFIGKLSEKYGEVQTGGRGRGKEKWIHPYLFLDVALWFSPKLKVELYDWVFDNLPQLRDNSGESFKEMNKAFMKNYNIGGKIAFIAPKVAKIIYQKCGVYGENKWERATGDQLKMREKMQSAFIALSYTTNNIEDAIVVIDQMFKENPKKQPLEDK
jgi:hypothetical protein